MDKSVDTVFHNAWVYTYLSLILQHGSYLPATILLHVSHRNMSIEIRETLKFPDKENKGNVKPFRVLPFLFFPLFFFPIFLFPFLFFLEQSIHLH
ncbi:MAG: hypothetical protein QXZ47_02525 [Candidatus Bathyarchaeia archaeon]